MPESAALLDRLRDHVGRTVVRCRRCDPARGVYCLRVERDAERFAGLRADEVLAGRRERLEWVRSEAS